MGTERTASYLLNESGIEVRHLQSLSHDDWSAVRLAKQTSGVILLYFEENSALVFQKDALQALSISQQ